MTTDQIAEQQQNLKDQIAQLDNERLAAIEQERESKMNDLADCIQIAMAYRSEAEKTSLDTERLMLYRAANDLDLRANELRSQLGLPIPDNSENDPDGYEQDKRTAVRRGIFELLLFSIFARVVFVGTDFVAGQLDSGFVSYTLDTISKVAYTVSGVYGGCWLVCVIAYRYVSRYAVSGIVTDLQTVGPKVRLFLLAMVMAALVFLISNLIHHV